MTRYMSSMHAARPREVNSWRAAGILYGDWGTSKAYVLGLAFALAGYSSFWYILAVSVLTLLVGLNYISICKFYPKGGGVYASVRDRSKVLSLIGAFFLISDYLVTAALSAVSAFHYLGVAQPEIWAMAAIAIIGMLNFLGPKHTGNLAIGLAVPTVIVVVCLGILSLPFLPKAVHQLTPISENLSHDWGIFVGIIVALSGIEAIANTTGSMKLDPGSTNENPSVVKTSTPAIVMVMLEVCIFTSLLGLAMNALPGLEISDGDVNAPGHPDVRDAMLRYMGQFFGSALFGPAVGIVFDLIICVVITLLLLSAVNTAMVALISLLFIMSRDEELPKYFQRLNWFGVPVYATLTAFMLPIGVLLFVHDIMGLANLYAIGFVGAIAVNLGATATNFKLALKLWQRCFMFATFCIMGLIEISLFIDKPAARGFVVAIVGVGLLLRALVIEQKEKIAEKAKKPLLPEPPKDLHGGLLVAITAPGKALDFALEEAEMRGIPLYILFIREQRVITGFDQERLWVDDEGACAIFDYVIDKSPKTLVGFLYTITSHMAYSIADIARQKKVDRVVIQNQRGAYSLLNILRGVAPRDIFHNLPKAIDLVVMY